SHEFSSVGGMARLDRRRGRGGRAEPRRRTAAGAARAQSVDRRRPRGALSAIARRRVSGHFLLTRPSPRTGGGKLPLCEPSPQGQVGAGMALLALACMKAPPPRLSPTSRKSVLLVSAVRG